MKPSASALLNRLLSRGKFRHLQVLLKLAELGSVQRTADAIGMTQSAVTQTLAYLERLLETPLFHRHARGVRPTPACMDLLPVARHVMLGVAEGAEIVAARENEGRQSVRLAASAAAINGLLVQQLPGFHERHPGIEVLLREAEGSDQLLAIARGEVDLVACRRPPIVPEGWTFRALREDRLVVVCDAAHPLARARRLDWARLGEHAWLLPGAGPTARERFDELAARFPTPARTYPLVTRAVAAMVWMLRQQQLLTLLPLSVVRHLVDAGELKVLPLADAGAVESLGLLLPLRDLPEPAARLAAFIEAD